jgi:hypothetical protein
MPTNVAPAAERETPTNDAPAAEPETPTNIAPAAEPETPTNVALFFLQVALHVSRMGDHGTPWGLTLSHALSFLSNLCVYLQIRESDCHDPSTCVWGCG